MLPAFSREAEDRLDNQENALRTAQDVRRVDTAFLAGWLSVTGIWMLVAVVSATSIGGFALASIPLLLRHFAAHR